MAEADPRMRPVDFDPFVPASAREVHLPLTEPQVEMWTAAAMSREANCSYNQCFAITLDGPLRVESLRTALEQVVARHEGLRTVIAPDGSGQTIRPPFALELPLVDHASLDPEARGRELEKLLEQECETPFDLAEGPLVRAVVVRESADSHVFVLTAHHIVCDGWSSSVLFADLGRLYTADCVGIPMQFGPAASYRQYVADEMNAANAGAAEADEEYWAAQYADGVPVLDLPVIERPAVKTYRSGREHLHIDEELYTALKRTGAASGATLFAMLLGAFEVLIYRVSGQPDVVIGIALAAQPKLDNPDLVAHCVSTVPLRARLAAERSFVEHVQAVRNDLAQAHEHSSTTFGSLVRRLNVARDNSRTPFVSITFTLDRIGAPFDFGDVTIHSIATPKTYSNFELALNVVDSGTDMVVECDYNVDLFDAATVRQWLSHYDTLLRAVVAQPEATLAALPIIDEDELQRILVHWNDTHEPFPDAGRLDGLFEAQVHRSSDADAVIDANERISYSELDRRANQLAHRLRDLCVTREVLVGVCLERSVELIVTLLAVLKAGGAYVPLDPDYPAARLALMVEDSQSPLIVTRRSLAAHLPAEATLLCLDEEHQAVAGEPTTKPEGDGAPGDLAYVIYTSGSTGRPNGVQIEHAAAANHMLWMREHLPLEPSDRVLQRTPLSFDASVWEVFAPLTTGACIVMAPPDALRATAKLADVIAEHGVTILQLVPSYARVFLDDVDIESCASLRRVLCGGEALPVSLYLDLRDRLGVDVVNLYGPTEACIDATWWPVLEEAERGATERLLGARGAVPIGRPISNCRAYVLDERLEPVPAGSVGELYLGGVGLARGYLGRDELTAERFVSASPGGRPEERLYRTGDLARHLPDGALEFLGRRDHQVKIRGYRIELGEIEAALRRRDDVADAVVVVREDRPGDERLVGYVIPMDAGTDIAERLRSNLRQDFPEYMVPAHIVVLPALPLMPNGKVDRQALPAPGLEPSHTAGVRHVAPRTATEEEVAAVWGEVLGIESPGVEDDFFESGGHSLIAARIVTRLRSSFQVALAMRHLFEQPTIAGLASIIDLLAVSDTRATPGRAAKREEIEI